MQSNIQEDLEMATEEKVIISCEKQKESLYYEIQGLDEEKRKLLWEILSTG